MVLDQNFRTGRPLPWANAPAVKNTRNLIRRQPPIRLRSACARAHGGIGGAQDRILQGMNSGMAVGGGERLHVQVLDVQGVFLDERPAAFDVVAHQEGEHALGLFGFFQPHAE